MSSHLAGCYVISLRPAGEHAALRRAAAAHGARVLALSPWKLVARGDRATRADLRAALAAPRVVCTSPAAVRAAAALRRLRVTAGQQWFAVGTGTALALRRAGIDATVPARMDSDGLLALPGLARVRGHEVGLLTAPGGRDRLAPALRDRGARVLRADVYERQPLRPAPRSVAHLRTLAAPFWLALSSDEALQRTLAALPVDARERLLRARVAAASARLADAARAAGFAEVVVAAGPRPQDLVEAMTRAAAPVR